MDVIEDDKKSLKKWIVSKRNKRDWNLAKHVEHVHSEQERLREIEEERKKKLEIAAAEKAANQEQPAWMARAHEARNRLNDRKTASAERWNRFAGTSEPGGRGL